MKPINGSGFSSVRERFETSSTGISGLVGGSVTPHYENNGLASGGLEGTAGRSKSKWNVAHTLTSGGRKASNSHVGNPITSQLGNSGSEGVTPRMQNGLNMIGNKSKLHSL